MARNDPAERLGRGPCPHCGEPVVFKRTKGRYVRYSCDACQSYGYAEEGGSACTAWVASIKAEPGSAPGAKPADLPPAPAPAAASRKSSPPKPASAPASVFSLGSL